MESSQPEEKGVSENTEPVKAESTPEVPKENPEAVKVEEVAEDKKTEPAVEDPKKKSQPVGSIILAEENKDGEEKIDYVTEFVSTRRPPDEFVKLDELEIIETTNITEDGSIVKMVESHGKGMLVDESDTVYYCHSTRFDNGQLVDIHETRRVPEKFMMSDKRFHEFLRLAFYTMKRGEVAYLKVADCQHRGMYHK